MSLGDVLRFFSGANDIPPLGFPHEAELNFNPIAVYPTASTCAIQLPSTVILMNLRIDWIKLSLCMVALVFRDRWLLSAVMPSTSSATTTAKSESIISQRRSLSRSRRNTVTMAECLSSHILHGRQRFVSLLTLQDPAGLGRLSMEELESTLLKMWQSISQESLELVIKSLPLCEDGMIDYRPLLKGGLTECVEKYFECSESCHCRLSYYY